MDIEKVAGALNSKTRRKILKILSDGAKNTKEISDLLESQYCISLYRESVFKALERLFEAELVEKYYEKGRGLVYRLKREKITIDFVREEVK
jgi:DNA-binding transcriptional ArsR family regulator